jgi:hypothetical protein
VEIAGLWPQRKFERGLQTADAEMALGSMLADLTTT